MMEIVLPTPTPKQREFLSANTPYVAFGGARGGGKSFAVRLKAKILALAYPGIRMLLLRRTYAELRENHIEPMRAETDGWATYREKDKKMTFSTGSVLKFGYCQHETDADQYQGQEYDVIFFDEGTHFSEAMFTRIIACNRGTNGFPKRVYVTCNPGGVGMAWVRRLFIDRQYNDGEHPEDYTFIQSRVYDNAPLLRSNPDYLKRLLALPPDLRRAWLDGEWDVFTGQYFSEFRRDAHVVSPFEIPKNWTRLVSMDYGLDMLAVLWGAFDEHGCGVIYREFCAPDLNVESASRAILDRCTPDEIQHDGSVRVIAPPDLWARAKDTGESIERLFWKNGVHFVRADNTRTAGWTNVKDWLRLVPDTENEGAEIPRLRIFENCVELARCLPLLQYGKRDSLDCDTEPHDITHAPDSLRYMLMARPKTAIPVDTRTAEEMMLADYKKRAIYGIKKSKHRVIM